MNQKDYNEIAGIINTVAIKGDSAWVNLVSELAQYFEREAQAHFEGKREPVDVNRIEFNRKQFLKDCGVE